VARIADRSVRPSRSKRERDVYFPDERCEHWGHTPRARQQPAGGMVGQVSPPPPAAPEPR
jgi:hypothetical protein